MNQWLNPFTEQRADPFILRDGSHYYFIASVPEHDRLEIRRVDSLEGLRTAAPVVVWRKPESGPMNQFTRAPKIHHLVGRWYIYFAVIHTQSLDKLGMFQHRMFALERADADPLTGQWTEKGQTKTQFDTFALDAITFNHQGKQWYLWTQKSPDIVGSSNIYFVKLENPWTIKGEPIMLSHPEYDQECRGFWVNEGPVVMVHGSKLFISYPANAIDENYCMGLLRVDLNANPFNPQNRHKSPRPIFTTSYENRQSGPGHNSFTQAPESEDVLVCHARNYTETEGGPLYDPNRHTRLKLMRRDENDMPGFDVPSVNTN